jgi:hypothetical protein
MNELRPCVVVLSTYKSSWWTQESPSCTRNEGSSNQPGRLPGLLACLLVCLFVPRSSVKAVVLDQLHHDSWFLPWQIRSWKKELKKESSSGTIIDRAVNWQFNCLPFLFNYLLQLATNKFQPLRSSWFADSLSLFLSIKPASLLIYLLHSSQSSSCCFRFNPWRTVSSCTGWTIPELDRSLDKYFVALILDYEEKKVRDSGLNPAWSLGDNL